MATTIERMMMVASALLTAALVTGCGGGGGTGGAGGGASAKHDSPQAVFDAATAAMEKEDFKAFCQTLTPDSRDVMAGGMVMAGVMMKAFAGFGGDEKGKAAVAEIDGVLKKHGIDEKALEKEEPLKAPEDEKAAMKKLTEPLKDKDAFIADMFKAMKAMDQGKSTKPLSGDAKLKDVKIDGDSAKGTLVTTADGKEAEQPIQFKKIDGGWKLDFDLGSMKKG